MAARLACHVTMAGELHSTEENALVANSTRLAHHSLSKFVGCFIYCSIV